MLSGTHKKTKDVEDLLNNTSRPDIAFPPRYESRITSSGTVSSIPVNNLIATYKNMPTRDEGLRVGDRMECTNRMERLYKV